MEQIFNCPSCGTPLVLGEKFCGNCGAPLDWSFLQAAPPMPQTGYDLAQPGLEQQQYINMQQSPAGWDQPPMQQQMQPPWEQQPPPGQYPAYPPYPPPPGQVQGKQKTKKTKGSEIPKKKGSVTTVAILLSVMILAIVFGGISFATGGGIFKPSTTSQPVIPPPASRPPAETAPVSAPAQPAGVPVITSFKSAPASLQAGQLATLSWEVTGANSISIDHGINSVASSGTQQVSPSTTTTYVLTAANGSGTVTASAMITVTGSPVNTPVVTSFTASPESIAPGGSATLQWNITGATSVSIDPGIGTVAASGSQSVSPTATTTYTLTAASTAGSVTGSATVTVGAATTTTPVIISFTATPSTITQGQQSTLQWNIPMATSISIDKGVGNPSIRSSPQVSPSATTTYTLTATNSAGSATATVTVTVVNAGSPVIISFTATPTVASGGSPTLQWNVTGATSVSIDQGVGAVAASGSQSAPPITAATTYTLTASNSAGIVTATAPVVIADSTVGLPSIVSFTANPSTSSPGGPVTLMWSVSSNTTSVTIEPGVGNVNMGNQKLVNPTTTTTYTLTANNASGSSAPRPVTVTVQ